MKKKTLATSKKGWWNMTKKERITATMERYDITDPEVKFDKQGNIKERAKIEVEPFNAELIFENEVFLKYIIVQLRKYLMERLASNVGGYICFGNEDLKDQWIVTEQFCEEMGIDFNFIQQLDDYLDCPTCEGDFVNDFSIEEILKTVRNFKKEDGNEQNKRTAKTRGKEISK